MTTNTIANSKYCRDCGTVIAASATACPHCGGIQAGSDFGSAGGRSRIVAFLLAICLGGIGIHKFYLGQNGQGILYLLFCWTGIPMFIAFVEAILYLLDSDERFAAKYP